MESDRHFKDIDDYIRRAPLKVQDMLTDIRKTIRKAAPDAQEKISYGMPTFSMGRNLVHFAAFKNHIGFYPMPSAINEFRRELNKYKTSKGAVQFPLDQKIPHALIEKMVKFRLEEIKNL